MQEAATIMVMIGGRGSRSSVAPPSRPFSRFSPLREHFNPPYLLCTTQTTGAPNKRERSKKKNEAVESL